MNTLTVTGTDTGVGKTWVSCLILNALRLHGLRTGAYKPACSGAEFAADGTPYWSDVRHLAMACGRENDSCIICPQRFLAPLAPNAAAEQEHRQIDNALLSEGLKAWHGQADFVIIEGAGGLLSPLSDTINTADIAGASRSPLLIVSANRLGTINHTCLTVEAAAARQLSVAAIVLNDAHGNTEATDPSTDSNALQLNRLLPEIPLLLCRFGSQTLQAFRSKQVIEIHEIQRLFGEPVAVSNGIFS